VSFAAILSGAKDLSSIAASSRVSKSLSKSSETEEFPRESRPLTPPMHCARYNGITYQFELDVPGRFSMSDPIAADVAKRAVGWSIFVSVIMIIAGLLAIALPLEAGIAVNLFLAWMLIFAAIAHCVFAWYTRRTGSVLLKVLLGVLYLAVAVYLLDHPARGLATLTLALAFYLLIEGVTESILYFQHRAANGASWFLLNSIITIILGGMIWATWPSSTEWVIGTLVGISIFFSGVSRLMISLAARRAVTTKLA
jgi:uncharacterized membrane protein HdeD (DUF308 family)